MPKTNKIEKETKAKIFLATAIEDLEKNLNNFLKDNPDIKVVGFSIWESRVYPRAGLIYKK